MGKLLLILQINRLIDQVFDGKKIQVKRIK